MESPLRFFLFYDPVFLRLSRYLTVSPWGAPVGVSSFVSLPPDLKIYKEYFAFLYALFGQPQRVLPSHQGPVLQCIFLYPQRFALQTTLVSLDSPGSLPKNIAITGSVSFPRALVEFRYARDNLLSLLVADGESQRIALPEGDGQRYRRLDEQRSPPLLSEAVDRASLLFAESLIREPVVSSFIHPGDA